MDTINKYTNLRDYFAQIYSMKDPDTIDFPLGGNSYSPLLILSTYLYFVLKWGPRFMKFRKPFQIRNTILLYNLMQIVVNFALVCYAFYTISTSWNNSICLQKSQQSINYTYFYYINKYMDLLETVFFVLRKKHNQISFLHLYHHIAVISVMYLHLVWMPYGLYIFYIAANCTVHTVMYAYYFLSLYNPDSKFLWSFKKRVTQIQLVQFGIMIGLFLIPIIFKICNYPTWLYWLSVTQSMVMVYMFGTFYIKNYVIKTKLN